MPYLRSILREHTRKLALSLGLVLSAPSFAAAGNDQSGGGGFERLRQETILKVKTRLGPLLEQYCKDACVLLDVSVETDEANPDGDELGFESVAGEETGTKAFVSKLGVEIQVDARLTMQNRERLTLILRNNLQKLAELPVEINWLSVTLPQIGVSAAKEEELRHGLEQRLQTAVDQVIETYCPEDCVLSAATVAGHLVSPDEAAALASEELVRDKMGDATLRVDGVELVLSVNSGLPADARQKIANLVRAKTRFASPLHLNLEATSFPESAARRAERSHSAENDPYGLDRLRQTLKVFRELAGTKEVITKETSHTAESKDSSSSLRDSSVNSGASSGGGSDGRVPAPDMPWLWLAFALIIVMTIGLVMALVLRFSAASRDARLMVEAAGVGPAQPGPSRSKEGSGRTADEGGYAGKGLSDEKRRDMGFKMQNSELREELVKCFLDQPRVAKETFGRLLQEEGIEDTARYVHIFGHLVIFELLGDPNMQRDLYELSEYFHKSEFDFTAEEEHRLLTSLRTRVTANEIRVLTRRQMDKFDFLAKLDAAQILNLISEEKPQIQSIVLTQLDHKRRRAVFDMYQGDAKVALMRELCRADAIPKEYLSNVAKSLHKKVQSRPEFDTENLRSSDILLDLLEKAALGEQRALMTNLMRTNAEAARGIKLRLVTVEVLPFLKDGHLLEIILGLEREDLLVFLAGSPEHVRDLILSKAPEELSDSWLEDLSNVAGAAEQTFRLVEMKILGRIRALAANGALNLLDINDMIFGKIEDTQSTLASDTGPEASVPGALVA